MDHKGSYPLVTNFPVLRNAKIQHEIYLEKVEIYQILFTAFICIVIVTNIVIYRKK